MVTMLTKGTGSGQAFFSPILTQSLHNQLDRQQTFRSSKKFKKQAASESNSNSISVPITIEVNLPPASENKRILMNARDDELVASQNEPNLPLLACYEDSSFLYCTSGGFGGKLYQDFRQASNHQAAPRNSTTSSNSSIFSSGPPSSNWSLLESTQDDNNNSSNNNNNMIARNGSSNSSGHYSASSLNSPSCPISAFDYCHLSSSSYLEKNFAGRKRKASFRLNNEDSNRGSATNQHKSHQPNEQATTCSANQQRQSHFQTTINAIDPVYLEDEQVFHNLIMKERSELEQRQLISKQNFARKLQPLQTERQQPIKLAEEGVESSGQIETPLTGQLRHSLLSWMLRICEYELCQDEIFSLATMILDKFLLFNPNIIIENDATEKLSEKNSTSQEAERGGFGGEMNHSDGDDDSLFCCNENELQHRQLYLFAACSLLLATKLRQTPRLCVQILIEFSKQELTIELSRDEILDGELLILATLKWNLAALITPNDFIAVIMNRCKISNSKKLQTDGNTVGKLAKRSGEPPANLVTVLNEQNLNVDKTEATTTKTTTTTAWNGRERFISETDAGVAVGAGSSIAGPITGNHLERKQEELVVLNEQAEVLEGRRKQQEARDDNCIDGSDQDYCNKTTTATTLAGQAEPNDKYQIDESRIKRHTQTLLELCLMDSKLSQIAPSILAMTSMAVAIDGLSMTEKTSWRLRDIVKEIHEANHEVNELKHLIDVASQIEKYVQKLLNYTNID